MPWDGVNPAKETETYDAKDKFQDPVAYFKHKEAMVAEEYVRVAEARLLRSQLSKCYKEAGVNYITDCRELAHRYMESIKGVGMNRANAGPDYKGSWK